MHNMCIAIAMCVTLDDNVEADGIGRFGHPKKQL